MKRFEIGQLEPGKEYCISDNENHSLIAIACGGNKKAFHELVDLANRGNEIKSWWNDGEVIDKITEIIKFGERYITGTNLIKELTELIQKKYDVEFEEYT